MTISILLLLAILSVIFCILNIILNGKTKYWEILTIIPIQIEILILVALCIISIITKEFVSLTLFIVSILSLIPYLDFTFFVPKNNKEKNDCSTISFLDMNTLFFYPSDKSDLIEYINKKDKDIVFLQEAFIPDSIESIKIKKTFPLAKVIGILDQKFLRTAFEEKYPYMVQGMDRVILSKTPLTIVRDYQIGKEFGYIVAKTLIDGKEIHLMNVHMPFIDSKKGSLDYTFGYNLRKTAFNELVKDIEIIEKDKGLFILSGDFNTAKSSFFILNLFKKYKEGITEKQLGLHISWHSEHYPFWRMDFLFIPQNESLDYVRTNLIKTKYSDHKGIEAQFILKK